MWSATQVVMGGPVQQRVNRVEHGAQIQQRLLVVLVVHHHHPHQQGIEYSRGDKCVSLLGFNLQRKLCTMNYSIGIPCSSS